MLWSQSDAKSSLGSRRALPKPALAEEWAVLQSSYRTEAKNQSVVLPKSHHRARRSPELTPDMFLPHAWTGQCCGFSPASWPHDMRLRWWLRSTRHLQWGHSAGGRRTWNMTSSWVSLHMWNLYNMLLPPPAYFMTRYRRSHPLGEQKHTKNVSMELSQR